MNFSFKQKKIIGIALIFIFVPIELLFLFALMHTVYTNEPGMAQTVISFVFTMGIFFFPLWWAFNLWNSSKSTPSPAVSIEESDPSSAHDPAIRIQAKLELSDYRKLLLLLTYKTPLLIFLHFIGLSMLAFYLVNGGGDWFVAFIVIFILYMPIAVLRSANSNYRANKCLHELVTYQFTPGGIVATGESFTSTMQWRMFYKIQSTNQWILLYTGKQVAMIIPEKAFASESDLNNFKRMCRLA